MPLFARWVGTGLLMTLGCASTLAATDLQINARKKVLDNGVTVLVWERESAGRVGARSFYKVDIAAERPGTIGLVHMLEHHLFKGTDIAGTKDWEAERAIAERVEILERMITDEQNRNRDCLLQREVFSELEAACELPRLAALRAELVEATAAQNRLADIQWYFDAVQSAGGTGTTASTGRDWMKFDVDLPANKLELFMWTERARVENPVFRGFEPEKEVVIDQIRRYDNNPDGKFSRVLRSMTYDAHPYGWAHWFSDLQGATREDHWEIFYKYFIPQNLVLVVVGEVEAEQVFAMAQQYFGDWQPGRPSPRLRTVEPESIGQKRLEVTAAGGPAVAINVPMPAVGHADAPVFDVLAELLGGPRGKLTALLVDEQNLATDAAASAWTSKYPSHFAMQVRARDNTQLDAIEAGINSALASLAAGTVSEEDLAAAVGRLTLSLAQNLEEIGNSAVTLGAMETIYDWSHLNALPTLWSAVSKDDLRRVIQRYFGSEKQIVGQLKRAASQAVADKIALNNEDTLASLNTVRPGQWPAGGPVDEFFLLEKGLAVVGAPRTDSTAPVQRGILGLHDAAQTGGGAPAASPAAKPAQTAQTAADIAYGEPLAIAEQPWYAPPFMVERRAARFASPAPTRDYRELRYPAANFVFPESEAYRTTLRNDLPVYIIADDLLPQVKISVLIDAPSSADPAGKAGLGALTAEILRQGSRSLDREAIEATLNRLGATLTVEHDKRATRLHAIAPSDAAEELASLLATLLSEPALEPGFDAERERHALRAERATDNALYATQALFDSALYGDTHALGARPTAASIRKLSAADLREHHRLHYTAARMTWVISGDINRTAVSAALQQHTALNALAAEGPYRPQFADVKAPQGLRVVTRQLDTRQAQVILGHLGIEGTPEDHAALEIMHHILAGGGFTSRMMTVLRSETGITSALYGQVEPGRGAPNPYQWRFGGNIETLGEGIGLALAELEKMHRDGVTEAEFEAARTTFIDGLIPASYDTAHKIGLRLAGKELFDLYDYQSPQYLNYYAGDAEQIQALRALTVDDVNAAARKYLNPANLVIAVTGQLEAIQKATPEAVKQRLGW